MDDNIKEKNLITFNVITLGESNVGKTSIIKRYLYNKFDEMALPTIGINSGFKEIKLKNNENIILKIIDTAGQERFGSLSKNYFKNADAVLFVFSLDKKESLDTIYEWKKLFEENKIREGIPTFLIRNKCDLDEEEFDEELVEDLLRENYFLRFVSISAKNDININELFEDLAENCYKKCLQYKNKKQYAKTISMKIPKKKRPNCCRPDDYTEIYLD